jgi:carbon storage regulator
MLVLTRKEGESIQIGENILLTVVAIENGQVKLGIQAPEGIKIYRSELYEQIQKQNTSASKVDRDTIVHAAKLMNTMSNEKKEK